MAFDAQALLNAVTTAASSTEYLVLPEKEEFVGQIKKVDLMSGTKEGRDWVKFTATFEASGQKVKEAINRDKANVKLDFFLDITESGGLSTDAGSNVRLGKLREACSQNKAGQQWSFQDLVGKSILFTVKHRKDANTGEIYQDVAQILPL